MHSHTYLSAQPTKLYFNPCYGAPYTLPIHDLAVTVMYIEDTDQVPDYLKGERQIRYRFSIAQPLAEGEDDYIYRNRGESGVVFRDEETGNLIQLSQCRHSSTNSPTVIEGIAQVIKISDSSSTMD